MFQKGVSLIKYRYKHTFSVYFYGDSLYVCPDEPLHKDLMDQNVSCELQHHANPIRKTLRRLCISRHVNAPNAATLFFTVRDMQDPERTHHRTSRNRVSCRFATGPCSAPYPQETRTPRIPGTYSAPSVLQTCRWNVTFRCQLSFDPVEVEALLSDAIL